MSHPPTFEDLPDYEPEWNTPEEAKKMADHMESVSPKFKAFMDALRAQAHRKDEPS